MHNLNMTISIDPREIATLVRALNNHGNRSYRHLQHFVYDGLEMTKTRLLFDQGGRPIETFEEAYKILDRYLGDNKKNKEARARALAQESEKTQTGDLDSVVRKISAEIAADDVL